VHAGLARGLSEGKGRCRLEQPLSYEAHEAFVLRME
jgi:hypothetical protein